jgi:hypothetical protein
MCPMTQPAFWSSLLPPQPTVPGRSNPPAVASQDAPLAAACSPATSSSSCRTTEVPNQHTSGEEPCAPPCRTWTRRSWPSHGPAPCCTWPRRSRPSPPPETRPLLWRGTPPPASSRSWPQVRARTPAPCPMRKRRRLRRHSRHRRRRQDARGGNGEKETEMKDKRPCLLKVVVLVCSKLILN